MMKSFEGFADKVKNVSSAYRTLMRKVTNEYGITVPKYRLLCGVCKSEGTSQIALAEEAGMQTPTVSLLLKQMELDGLIFRVADKYDLRKTHVHSSEKGKELYSAVSAEAAMIEASILGSVSQRDAENFFSVLNVMEKNCKELIG